MAQTSQQKVVTLDPAQLEETLESILEIQGDNPTEWIVQYNYYLGGIEYAVDQLSDGAILDMIAEYPSEIIGEEASPQISPAKKVELEKIIERLNFDLEQLADEVRDTSLDLSADYDIEEEGCVDFSEIIVFHANVQEELVEFLGSL